MFSHSHFTHIWASAGAFVSIFFCTILNSTCSQFIVSSFSVRSSIMQYLHFAVIQYSGSARFCCCFFFKYSSVNLMQLFSKLRISCLLRKVDTIPKQISTVIYEWKFRVWIFYIFIFISSRIGWSKRKKTKKILTNHEMEDQVVTGGKKLFTCF